MPVSPVCAVTFNWTLPDGKDGANVMHFAHSGDSALDQTDIDSIASAAVDWYENDNFSGETNQAFKKVLNAHITLNNVHVRTLPDTEIIESFATSGVAGTGAGVPVPVETAVVATYYTDLAGRSYRGRSYFAGASVLDVDNDGTFKSANRSGWQDPLDAWVAAWQAVTDVFFCVWSPTLGEATEVTSVVVRDTFHHQKRRNP